VNVLECLRTLLGWARSAEVRKLPVEWHSPLTHELIGEPPTKDPLRQDPLPMDTREKLAGLMDAWQLCHLALFLVLPMRPGEAAGLLISDVDADEGWLKFGTRFEGNDFTKGKVSFNLPFPDELKGILQACIGGRREGPLLRSRQAFLGRCPAPHLDSPEQ